MARYIDADKLKLDIDLSQGATVVDLAISVIKAVKEAPTADVVPKKEIANVLCDLKIAVHNKALYRDAKEVPSYVYLKVFDAIIKDYLNKIEKR
jgi:hypothetical protein